MSAKRLNCVLIVDDDRVSNYVTENVLRGLGIASMINTVNDGQAGLEYIKYQCTEDEFACPDLIILDINMRLINGVEFVREFRRMKISPNSVIVVLSTLPLKAEQEKELRSFGVHDFLVKPLNAEKLNHIMDEHFYQES